MLDFMGRRSGRMLDYGCGDGEVVRAGLAHGLDIYGCDLFYSGSHGPDAVRDLIASDRIRPMSGTAIPFADGAFDCVVSNQVFEHVVDIEAALAEIHRVLRPNGQLLAMFPSREVLREGHCGVPLAHKFSNTPFGYYWLLAFRLLGLGKFTHGKRPTVWAKDFQRWLNDYCVYRSQKEIDSAFAVGFRTIPFEREYIHFRRLPLFTPSLFRRLAFMVLLSTRL